MVKMLKSVQYKIDKYNIDKFQYKNKFNNIYGYLKCFESFNNHNA